MIGLKANLEMMPRPHFGIWIKFMKTYNLKATQKRKSICNNQNLKDYYYPVYQFIRDNGGFQNWDIIVIERVEYNHKYELKARERFHLEELKATLNKQTPNKTRGEWFIDNKEHVKEYKLHYRQDNINRIKQHASEKHNCECGGRYTTSSISTHKKSKRHQNYSNN